MNISIEDFNEMLEENGYQFNHKNNNKILKMRKQYDYSDNRKKNKNRKHWHSNKEIMMDNMSW